MIGNLSFDVAHLLAGGLVLASFMLLYQDRLPALVNVFTLHALLLSASVAWQAHVQEAPHLFVTAVIALVFKAGLVPAALHRIIRRLGIHREVEPVVGIGQTMLAGMGLVALSLALMLRVAAMADALAREDLAFALSVILLGLLLMVSRRNAVSQVVGRRKRRAIASSGRIEKKSSRSARSGSSVFGALTRGRRGVRRRRPADSSRFRPPSPRRARLR